MELKELSFKKALNVIEKETNFKNLISKIGQAASEGKFEVLCKKEYITHSYIIALKYYGYSVSKDSDEKWMLISWA